MRRFLALAVLALAGCMVGPDYHRPETPGEGHGWIDRTDTAAPAADPWARLNDRLLTTLIARALAENRDIAAAEARLREARARRGGALAEGLPQIVAKGSAQKVELSKNGELPLGDLPGFQNKFSLFDAGFDASWEIDLWGAHRRGVEAATRQVAAAAERVRGVRLEVAAEVARDYADLRAAQASITTTRADAAAREDLAALVLQRRIAGETTALDEAAARQQARSTRAELPALEASARAAMTQLAVLTGQPPEALLGELDSTAPVPHAPADVAVGLRSDVLRRRPDVAAAEADLAAATAGIGMAIADLFPRLTLAGSLEQQSRDLGTIAGSGSTAFTVGPTLHWPVFDAGRIRARIRAARARNDEAAANYTKTVLGALADSEIAANGYAAAQASLGHRDAALASATTRLALVRQRFAAGEDDRLALLEAVSARATAERAAIGARQRAVEAYAALIKALGD